MRMGGVAVTEGMLPESGLHFVALLGSLRDRSACRAVANTLDEIAPEDVQVTILDTVGELPYFNADVAAIATPDRVLELASAIGSADALVIVTPEYERSMPGALKNALDWLGREARRPLSGKPVALQTASDDGCGGVRAQDHLRQALLALDALVLGRPEIMIPQVTGKVDAETRTLTDEVTRRQIAAQLRALAQLTRSRG